MTKIVKNARQHRRDDGDGSKVIGGVRVAEPRALRSAQSGRAKRIKVTLAPVGQKGESR